MKLVLGILFALMMIITIPNVFAEITIQSDKTSYSSGDIIQISGTTDNTVSKISLNLSTTLSAKTTNLAGFADKAYPLPDGRWFYSVEAKTFSNYGSGNIRVTASQSGEGTVYTIFAFDRSHMPHPPTNPMLNNTIHIVNSTSISTDNQIITDIFSLNSTMYTMLYNMELSYMTLINNLTSIIESQNLIILNNTARIISLESNIPEPELEITICHVPPNTPETIIILESDWLEHASHGDYLGECIVQVETIPDNTKSKPRYEDEICGKYQTFAPCW